MLVFKYIILGIVQGLTEFLPVSSSAHLIIFQNWLQINQNQLLLNIVLHVASLLAIVLFLFKDIRSLLKIKIVGYLLLATALTGTIAVGFQEHLEKMFLSPRGVALPLLITGILLLFTKTFKGGKRDFEQLHASDAVWFGLVQGLAAVPGISRSGSTISTLLFRGIEKETAFKFSFLASILAILGALCCKLKDFSQISYGELNYITLGFVAAFFTSLLALKILITIIRKARLYLFGYYCIALGLWGFFAFK